MRRLVFAILVLCVTATSGRAQSPTVTPAQHREAARYFQQGLLHFEQGAYAEAVTDFEAGYALQPEPLFLYNIAQAARHAGDLHKALAFYRRYLAAGPDAKRRVEVEGWIRTLELAARTDAAALPSALPPPNRGAAAAAPAARSDVAAAATAPATVERAPAAAIARPPERATRSRWYRDPAAAVLLGAGVGALAVGGTLVGVAARAEADALRSYGAYDAFLRGSGPDERVAGVVVLGVGGALVVGGVVRWIVVARRGGAAR